MESGPSARPTRRVYRKLLRRYIRLDRPVKQVQHERWGRDRQAERNKTTEREGRTLGPVLVHPASPLRPRHATASLLGNVKLVVSGGRRGVVACQIDQQRFGTNAALERRTLAVTITAFAVGAVLAAVAVITVAIISVTVVPLVFDVAVAVTDEELASVHVVSRRRDAPRIGAAGAVAVAAAVAVVVAVTVAAILLAGGVVAGAAARRGGAATTGRTGAAAVTVATGLEAPGSRRRSSGPLSDALAACSHRARSRRQVD